MELRGIPLHPLVVHAVVVLVPLATLAAIALVVPRWRWLARWPALLLALGAAGAVQVAMMTGENLQETRGLDTALVHTHEEWANRLRIATFVFTAVVVVAFWALPHVTRLVGGHDREARVAVLTAPLTVLVPILSGAVLVLVFLTGDAGARAVWGGS